MRAAWPDIRRLSTEGKAVLHLPAAVRALLHGYDRRLEDVGGQGPEDIEPFYCYKCEKYFCLMRKDVIEHPPREPKTGHGLTPEQVEQYQERAVLKTQIARYLIKNRYGDESGVSIAAKFPGVSRQLVAKIATDMLIELPGQRESVNVRAPRRVVELDPVGPVELAAELAAEQSDELIEWAAKRAAEIAAEEAPKPTDEPTTSRTTRRHPSRPTRHPTRWSAGWWSHRWSGSAALPGRPTLRRPRDGLVLSASAGGDRTGPLEGSRGGTLTLRHP